MASEDEEEFRDDPDEGDDEAQPLIRTEESRPQITSRSTIAHVNRATMVAAHPSSTNRPAGVTFDLEEKPSEGDMSPYGGGRKLLFHVVRSFLFVDCCVLLLLFSMFRSLMTFLSRFIHSTLI